MVTRELVHAVAQALHEADGGTGGIGALDRSHYERIAVAILRQLDALVAHARAHPAPGDVLRDAIDALIVASREHPEQYEDPCGFLSARAHYLDTHDDAGLRQLVRGTGATT